MAHFENTRSDSEISKKNKHNEQIFCNHSVYLFFKPDIRSKFEFRFS